MGGVAGLAFGRLSSIAVSALLHWPTQASLGAAIARAGRFRRCRHYFWILPRVESLTPEPH